MIHVFMLKIKYRKTVPACDALKRKARILYLELSREGIPNYPTGIPSYPRRYFELSQEVFRIIPNWYSELSQKYKYKNLKKINN